MASIYTYEQFEKAAKDAGLYDRFSTADLNLAKQYPDAGMSILKFKQDFVNATTDEERALANLGAETERSSYGNYHGGQDGSGFYLDPLSPSSFNAGSAPEYKNNYSGDIKDLWNQQKNYGEYSYSGGAAPEYTNRYDKEIQKMLDDIINRKDFSYDPNTDPLYSQYRKAYTREGQRATQDTLGAAAAASGGIPSSYATTAAAQAGNYYASQMTDKIPELYQLAYNKYLSDYNMKLSDLGAVQGAEQSDYDKYLNQLQQYNTDRNFDYNKWMDNYNMLSNKLQTASGLEQLDYTKYLDQLNQYNTDRNFNYGQMMDEINSQSQERQEAMNKALTAAQYGDYSFLQDMGINMDNNPADWERQYQMAQLGAQFGDYSGLQNMGINTEGNPTDWERQYQLALLAAEYGDFSGLNALGIKPNMELLQSLKSSGRSNAGGGGGNNNENPADLTTDIPPELISSIKASYPNGKITSQEDWDYLVGQYGEDALLAAGFTYGIKDTKAPETNINDYYEILRSNPNFSMMQQTLEGISSKEAMEDQIAEFAAQGMLTREEIKLLAQMYGVEI